MVDQDIDFGAVIRLGNASGLCTALEELLQYRTAHFKALQKRLSQQVGQVKPA